ncbi:hypothetical protein BH09BAC5_BH09BAC5_22250 [soil metagenome]
MKNKLLIVFLFLNSTFLIAQEFTKPDSLAILKSQVKSVRIYYDGNKNQHTLSHEFQYDSKGRNIYLKEGTTKYYYSFAYNEKSQQVASFQRTENGIMIAGYLFDYYPGGQKLQMKRLNKNDTINPEVIFTYDTIGNIIEENYFFISKLTRSYHNKYDSLNNLIHRIDSTPQKYVYESFENKTIRQTYYNDRNEVTENCFIRYNANGNISNTTCIYGADTLDYFVIYGIQGAYHIERNGKPIEKPDYVYWDGRFKWLIPRLQADENPLPYSDPNSNPEYLHTIKRDKKGNITEDKITRQEKWNHDEPVYYTYEYTYWK